jgi:site-specific recombinase XerD
MDLEEIEIVSQFFNERTSTRGTLAQSVRARREELNAALKILHEQGARLHNITTAQALSVVNGTRQAGFSQNYERRVIMTFKSLLLWFASETITFTTPDGDTKNLKGSLDWKKIKAIKPPGIDWFAKSEEDILTTEEVTQIIDACSNSRDRCIIATLYDGSFRPGEIIGFTWGDLKRDEYGIRMTFETPKTKKIRNIRFTFAVPYINAWQQDYPIPLDAKSPLFTQTVMHSHKYMALTMDGLSMTIRRLKKQTGIEKLMPSILRPSRITHDVSAGVDMQYIALKNWGSLRTPMIDIYAKPGRDYIDRVALEQAGITLATPQREENTLVPAICTHCQTLNVTGAHFCVQCGRSLVESAEIDQGDLVSKLMADPSVLRQLADEIERRKVGS